MTRSVRNRRRILKAVGRDVSLPDSANVPNYDPVRSPNDPSKTPDRPGESDSAEKPSAPSDADSDS